MRASVSANCQPHWPVGRATTISAFPDWMVEDNLPSHGGAGAENLVAEPGLVQLLGDAGENDVGCRDDVVDVSIALKSVGDNPGRIVPISLGFDSNRSIVHESGQTSVS
ncbi:hypothetical protein [Rhodococcus qingshengii]|uniref:hypothetical protein n=1 Tax=Rhodococcus qingshengii TaxID=334542 RepID=UPI001BEAAD79|nr:hypothetical protein [Rhodococcus qingshengii]MBT2273653.1 hypothetical protein [Rhodococcus qingshengii]